MRTAGVSLVLIVYAIIGALGASASNRLATVTRPDAASAASMLSADLEAVSSVAVYSLTRTEEYEFSSVELRNQSSVRVFRGCGGNCHNYLLPVVEHLRSATPTRCVPGGEDVLIDGDARMLLMYRDSGRMIQYRGTCYQNPVGIIDVLQSHVPVYI